LRNYVPFGIIVGDGTIAEQINAKDVTVVSLSLGFVGWPKNEEITG
jgi:hypothetical protein